MPRDRFTKDHEQRCNEVAAHFVDRDMETLTREFGYGSNTQFVADVVAFTLDDPDAKYPKVQSHCLIVDLHAASHAIETRGQEVMTALLHFDRVSLVVSNHHMNDAVAGVVDRLGLGLYSWQGGDITQHREPEPRSFDPETKWSTSRVTDRLLVIPHFKDRVQAAVDAAVDDDDFTTLNYQYPEQGEIRYQHRPGLDLAQIISKHHTRYKLTIHPDWERPEEPVTPDSLDQVLAAFDDPMLYTETQDGEQHELGPDDDRSTALDCINSHGCSVTVLEKSVMETDISLLVHALDVLAA